MVFALDTNVLLRMILNDDAAQLARVLRVLDGHIGFIQDTVVLETVWVLQSLQFSIGQIASALTKMIANADIKLESAERLAEAVNACSTGLDFADAFHLAGAATCPVFLTFDKQLLKRGGRAFDLPQLREP